MCVLLDQYGGRVPTDLVLLPTLTADPDDPPGPDLDVEAVLSATWYETDGILMASAKEILDLSEDDPADAGVELHIPNLIIQRVDRPLNRWTPEDGFYHA